MGTNNLRVRKRSQVGLCGIRFVVWIQLPELGLLPLLLHSLLDLKKRIEASLVLWLLLLWSRRHIDKMIGVSG